MVFIPKFDFCHSQEQGWIKFIVICNPTGVEKNSRESISWHILDFKRSNCLFKSTSPRGNYQLLVVTLHHSCVPAKPITVVRVSH